MSRLVCAVFIDGDKTLLVQRALHRKWSPMRWDLVGGHVEKGEELGAAMVRESEEEIGLTPTTFQEVAVLFEPDDTKKKSPFHVYFVSSWHGGDAQLLGNEHAQLGWFTRKEVEQMDLALEDYRQVILSSFSLKKPPSES